jgi:transposase
MHRSNSVSFDHSVARMIYAYSMLGLRRRPDTRMRIEPPVVDSKGLPVRLAITAGEAHDNRLAAKLLSCLKPGSMRLADRGYDADRIRDLAAKRGAWPNIPPRRNRNDPICFSHRLYRARNAGERFFNKVKQCRRIATRYDKLAANYLAFIQRRSGYGCALMSPRPSHS